MQEFRDNFSKKLNKFGYQSKSTNYYSDKDKQHIKQINNYNQFVIKDYGNAPYQNSSNGKASFFITYETQKGNEVTLWGKGLKDEVTKNNIEKGDRVSIIKQTKQTNTGKINQWRINVIQKHLEKDFNKSMTMRERIRLQQKTNNNPQVSKPKIIKTSKLKLTIRLQVEIYQTQKKFNPIEQINEQFRPKEPNLKQTVRQKIETQQKENTLPKQQIEVQPDLLFNEQKQSSLRSALDRIIQSKKDNEKQKSNKHKTTDY